MPQTKHQTAFLSLVTTQPTSQAAWRHYSQRLALLARAAEHLLSTDDSEAMVQGLYEMVAEHLELDTCLHYRTTEAEDALQLDFCTGLPEPTRQAITRLEFGQALCGTVALQRCSIVAEHIQQSCDPRAQGFKELGIRASCCHPLMVGDRLLGTLTFASRTRDEFDEDEVELLRMICHYVAMAKERMRLYAAAQEEIARRTQIEEELLRHQEEIEALNKQLRQAMTETHHRVKNNLQIIASMIDMRVMDNPLSIPTEEIRRLGIHIGTLAVVHELLTQQAHRDGQAHTLSTRDLLTRLVGSLQRTLSDSQIECRVEDRRLTTRQATSLALVTNELVSNALKHGRGKVLVTWTVEEQGGLLEVCDGGPGFPANFDPIKEANTGLALVESLARHDLGGQTRYENRLGGGGRVCVTVLDQTPHGS